MGVPGGSRSVTGAPPSVGTLISAPSTASSKATGAVSVRLSPLRPKTGWGRTLTVTSRSPAAPPCSPAAPLPLRRIFWPSRDAGRDPRRHGAVGHPAAGTVAGGARLVVDELAAVALGAGLVHRERATDAVDHDAGALAGAADVGTGAGLAAGARAGGARGVRAQPHADGGAVDGVGEVDDRLGLDVGAASGTARRAGAAAEAATPARAALAEEVAEEVGDVEAAGPARGGRSTRPRSRRGSRRTRRNRQRRAARRTPCDARRHRGRRRPRRPA